MERKRFFGLHFDFHADNFEKIGERTNEEDIAWYIEQAEPDFIQCDSKGHAGISSYPTEIGKTADNLVSDNLKVWSKTAKKYGIPLYVHHSGVYDLEYVTKNPDQAQCDKEGKIIDKTSLFGKYADEYLIPQIIEMIDKYDIDGVWMDGECWAVDRDYSSNAKKYIPESITGEEHDEIMRRAFEAYMKKCSDAWHKHKPNFKYVSNWAYSSYMPEKPIEGVLDSLSGDYPPTDSLYAARYEGRCLAAQNMPWDLMCWSFMREWLNPNFRTTKTLMQLQQEAAAVLMLGGGFQLYIKQNKDGSAIRSNYTPLKPLAEFVKKRRFLFEKKPLAQVGIYYSATSRYKDSEIYNAAGATKELIGAINAVLSAQYTANVVLEYQIDTLSYYEIIVVPEWKKMCDNEKEKLIAYAENGGNLIVFGAELSKQIGEMCSFNFGEIDKEGDSLFKNPAGELYREKYRYIMDEDGGFEQINGDFLDLKSGEGYIYYDTDIRNEYLPSYRMLPYGKGKIAFIPFDFGKNYFELRSQKKCRYLKNIIQKLKKPFIEINRTNIDISILETSGGILVNLLNLYQNRYDVKFDVVDEVPPLYDVELVINKPYSSVKMPLGEAFDFEVTEKQTKIRLKKLEIHSVIVLAKE